MNKQLKKSDISMYLNVFQKLTDSRYNFNIYSCYQKDGSFKACVDMYFCDEFICSSSFDHLDINVTNAFECLVDMLACSEKQKNKSYFEKIGVSFEIYHNRLNGKDYFQFRKNESDNWRNISYTLATEIIQSEYAEGSCDNVVSYSEYDCYYQVNIKG